MDASIEFLIRIALSLVAGLVLGLERESHGRAAGIRTTALVCMAACLAMMLSDSYYLRSLEGSKTSSDWHPDPARLAAGVLTGMGFLGAGVIIRQGNLVRGVTTAAVLWLATILGLAFGSGAYLLGVVSLSLGIVILLVLPAIEKRVANDWYSFLTVSTTLDGPTPDDLAQCLAELGVKVKEIELECDFDTGRKTISCRLKYKRHGTTALPELAVKRLSALPRVSRILWK